MFNFLKKKGENQIMVQPVPPPGGDSNPFNQPNNQQTNQPISPPPPVNPQNFQQTKVEDDVASFEIPDFSEDDLNFDLGLGEFMPESSTQKKEIIEPKGLPIPELKPTTNINVEQSFPVPPPPMPLVTLEPAAIQTQMQPAIVPENKVEKISKDESISDINVEIKPQIVSVPSVSPVVVVKDEKENKFSWSAGPTEEDSPDDDLPKFNITPTLSLAEIKNIEVKTAKQKKKVVKAQKETKEETPVQSSLEGLFLPKNVFNKLVIIADDTTKKSLSADFQKAGIMQISETQEAYISDLTKTLKSIMESLLLADEKLFGEGE